MFRIRRIHDDILPVNRTAISLVQQILRDQFPQIRPAEINSLPEKLKNPLKYKFRSILFVADDLKKTIQGFALLMHAPDLNFCFLDYISTARHQTGRGIGGALYERVREETLQLNCKGLFFECLPDDPRLCTNQDILKQNISRLKFYERYGARPLINTLYETPVIPGSDNPPFLVIDTLGTEYRFSKTQMQTIVQAILERKYPDICNREYIEKVVNSIKDKHAQLGPFRYSSENSIEKIGARVPRDQKIVLVCNDRHAIHHVRERGYVESPVRIDQIRNSLRKTELFEEMYVRHFSDDHITAVHDSGFYRYLQTICAKIPDSHPVYPYVFPIRNPARPPKDLPMRAGYYCIDTFTPLSQSAFRAARRAVDCALTAASAVMDGAYLAYALIRPPGHHAERKVFGGFCYLNSCAIAAHFLSRIGKVAILDIDYHHGNGQEDIFYHRADVLTVSIHGNPRFAYPFFSGFAEECGKDEGMGFNLNFPLPEQISNDKFIETLEKAILRIRRFTPDFLLVALGFDTALGDPTGTWNLDAASFKKIGQIIGELPYPTLLIQEGGYKTKTIGRNAVSFFMGLWTGSFRD